jgi:hypothetical protein
LAIAHGIDLVAGLFDDPKRSIRKQGGRPDDVIDDDETLRELVIVNRGGNSCHLPRRKERDRGQRH